VYKISFFGYFTILYQLLYVFLSEIDFVIIIVISEMGKLLTEVVAARHSLRQLSKIQK
jgi:hypothetical protein